MKKNVVELLAALGGLLAALLGTKYFLNYHEMDLGEWIRLWAITSLALYLFGIYTTALISQQLLRQESAIEPSFLVLGCITGLHVLSLPLFIFLSLSETPYLFDCSFLILPISLLLSFLGIRSACRFKRSKSNANLIVLLFKVLIPSIITFTWIMVNSFPGVTAPAKIRQEWAYKEFSNYDQVVNSIKRCQPIIKRVGYVIFVAPTKGLNYVVYEPGSSGHHGELTLEVVGERGTGVANFGLHIFTAVSSGQFTYQKKTEELVCKS